MTTRNITKHFEGLRNQAKKQHSLDQSNQSNNQNGNLLPDGSIDSSAHANNAINVDLAGLMSTTPPKWVDIVDTIRTDINQIDVLRGQLENAYSQRLKVSFSDDHEQTEKIREELVDNLTHQTTVLIKRIEGKIKSIAFCEENDVSNNNNNNKKKQQPTELSQSEKNVRLNVMRNLGAMLHTKSRAFKQQQREFLSKLQQQQHIGNDIFSQIANDKRLTSTMSNGDLGLMLDQALEQGLTDEQQMELDEIEQRADEREKEIIHLAQNINELATLFQELNVLVIEQGTLLDRIDYSVEQTLINVQKGREVLVEAEEKSSANWLLKFMIIMIAIIAVEIIMLAVKWKIMGR